MSKNTTKIRICEMYIGNPEIYEIGSGTKLLFTFLSLRFFDMRRERHNFFNKLSAHFVDPNWSRRGETKNRLPYSRLESQLILSEFKSQLTVFFSKFQNHQRFTSPVSFSIWFFLWHLWLSHPPRAHVNTCTECVYLTKPFTKPKGFQPN